jgi:hypothetical protein
LTDQFINTTQVDSALDLLLLLRSEIIINTAKLVVGLFFCFRRFVLGSGGFLFLFFCQALSRHGVRGERAQVVAG